MLPPLLVYIVYIRMLVHPIDLVLLDCQVRHIGEQYIRHGCVGFRRYRVRPSTPGTTYQSRELRLDPTPNLSCRRGVRSPLRRATQQFAIGPESTGIINPQVLPSAHVVVNHRTHLLLGEAMCNQRNMFIRRKKEYRTTQPIDHPRLAAGSIKQSYST